MAHKNQHLAHNLTREACVALLLGANCDVLSNEPLPKMRETVLRFAAFGVISAHVLAYINGEQDRTEEGFYAHSREAERREQRIKHLEGDVAAGQQAYTKLKRAVSDAIDQ